jgi:CRISPR/Cas system-associated exonuclease Cas4 (RecB family)
MHDDDATIEHVAARGRGHVSRASAIRSGDNGITVWEVKTSKRRWAADMLDFDLQVTGYKMASRVLDHGEVDVKLLVATKAKCPDVQIERLVRHRKDERELSEIAFGVHRALEAGVDHPVRGWQCRSCPYADACGS